MAYIAAMLRATLYGLRSVERPVMVALAALLFAGLVLVSPDAAAHPEDEFCVPGEPGIDPALCRALETLNSGEQVATDAELAPLLDDAGNERGFWSTFGLYVTIGVNHILPGGLDHILFVLAVFLASSRMSNLIWQITAFTVAHTVTLALAATGVVSPSPDWVEPFIALTIAFVAVENVVFRDMNWWRPIIVFVFGLVHGLGFAGFFGELGLPSGQFWSALLGFNLGVEVGQLSVVALALVIALLLRRQFAALAEEHGYRRFIVIPCSTVIGAIGLWWTVERVLS